MTKTIDLVDVGPIETLSIPVPADGGLVVLRGRSGCGKTHALSAVDALVTGRGTVPVRDRQQKARVEAFGATLTVGRTSRRTGQDELEVHTLEGKLDLGTLVDPMLKDAGAADAKRIKALVALSGVDPSVEAFWPLVGGREQFEAVVSETAVKSDDLVQMAERIKRDLEAKARAEEDQVKHAEGRAQAAKEGVGKDFDPEEPPADDKVMQTELEAAVSETSRLRNEVENAAKARQTYEKAQAELADEEAEYDGPDLATALAEERDAQADMAKAHAKVDELRKAHEQAQKDFWAIKNLAESKTHAREGVEKRDALLAGWKQTVEAGVPTPPTDAQVDAATKRYYAAKHAIEVAAIKKRARQQWDEAMKATIESKRHAARAETLRDAARSTDDVLSAAVAKLGCPLRVEAGRLFTDTDRGPTLFAELSDGERTHMALDIAASAVGEGGLIVIPQRLYQDLDPHARLEIAERLKRLKVVAVTAEVTGDDELTAEVYDG